MAFETQCSADTKDGGGLTAFKGELQHKLLAVFLTGGVVFPLFWLYFKNAGGFLNSFPGIYFDSGIGCHCCSDYV